MIRKLNHKKQTIQISKEFYKKCLEQQLNEVGVNVSENSEHDSFTESIATNKPNDIEIEGVRFINKIWFKQ